MNKISAQQYMIIDVRKKRKPNTKIWLEMCSPGVQNITEKPTE